MSRYKSRYKRVHYCGITLPDGAVRALGGRSVASPELCFLELAKTTPVHKLILFGLQLCSRKPWEGESALTTKRQIHAFLEKTQGFDGHRRAVRAAKYLEDCSASVMESLAYMILTLPHALGGYGLAGAVFNHEIPLDEESRRQMRQNRCFVDIYFRKQKVAVEYQSFSCHSRPLEQGRDMMKSIALERRGITVMPLSTIQLYVEGACREFAAVLAKRLGKRIQIQTPRFEGMHAQLRSLLEGISEAYRLKSV